MQKFSFQRVTLFGALQTIAAALPPVPPEFPSIGAFLIIGVGHPWLPRPSAGLLDPTYRCTCTCHHQRGPQALESTQGGEEPDRFRAPRGVHQVLKSLKKITKQTATPRTCLDMFACPTGFRAIRWSPTCRLCVRNVCSGAGFGRQPFFFKIFVPIGQIYIA